jgi:hypothetical protein
MNIIAKATLSLLFASAVAIAGGAATARPAEAATFVSAGFGASAGVGVAIHAGYAPRYHWYRWHDGFGWHRRWVPFGWVEPVAYAAPPRVFVDAAERPRYFAYGRPGYWRDDRGWRDDHREHIDHAWVRR